LYEGGVRVAAFATWDGHIPAGSTNKEPMHVVDWRPTLEKLCDASQTGDLPMDGKNIWPTLAEGKASPHDAILLNTTPSEGAVRAGDWKLIVKQGVGQGKGKRAARRPDDTVELFNLKQDPYEKSNLADEQPEKVSELRQALKKFAEQAVPPKASPQPKSYEAPKIWGEVGG
jgi:arylsulfatase A-like enzyme